MALLIGQTSLLFRSAKFLRSLAAYDGKWQEVAVAVCVSTAVWPLIQIDKLADVNFIVAAHQFVQSCKNNCHVLSVTHLKSFVIELSRFRCDSYGKARI